MVKSFNGYIIDLACILYHWIFQTPIGLNFQIYHILRMGMGIDVVLNLHVEPKPESGSTDNDK